MEPLWLFVASGRHLLRNLNHVKTNSFDSKHIDSLFPSFLSAGKVVAVMHGANAPMMKARTSAKELVPLKQVVKLRRELSANDTS